jgi:hypothetical protein
VPAIGHYEKLAINTLESRKVDLLKQHGLKMAVLCVELNNEVKNIQIMLHIAIVSLKDVI